jgi:protein TonB
MSAGSRALGASAAIHLVLAAGIAVALQMAATPAAPADPAIDLPEDLLGGRAGGPGPAPGTSVAPAVVPAPAPAVTPANPAPAAPMAEAPSPVLSREASAAPSPTLAVPGSDAAGAAGSAGAAGATGTGPGTGSGAGPGTGPGAGPGNGLEVLRQIYRKEHFAYIQAQVARVLVYPPLAARAGWTGRVLVVFLVQEDGTAAEVGIAAGSGVPLLDREAQAAVKRASPFPRPPVPARLVLPIEFDLE